MFLQINTAIITYIINSQQCSFISSCQSRNTESSRTIITGMAYPYSYPMSYILRWNRIYKCFFIINLNSNDLSWHFIQQRGARFHLQTDPEIIDSGKKFLLSIQYHFPPGIIYLWFINRIRRICSQCLPWHITRNVGNRKIKLLTIVLTCFRTSIIQLDRLDVWQVHILTQS